MLPDDPNNLPADSEVPSGEDAESVESKTDQPKRRRMRVKIRKKIRIKQKPSAKKLIRKIAERSFWVIIIVGFLASLIIMIIQLDVRDEKFKQQLKKGTPNKGSQ